MLLDIILILIAVICLGIIIIIIIKKFSRLSLIDMDSTTVEKQLQTKRKIIEDRLKRNIFDVFRKSTRPLRPLINKFLELIRQLASKIIELEEEYRYRVLNLRLKDKVFKDQRVSKLLKEAILLKSEEKYELAEKKYIEIIKIDQFYLEAYKGLSDIYWLMKNYEQAKETLEYALKLSENDDYLFSQLAKISLVRGDLKQAEHDYLRSIDINNQNSANYFDLGWIYLQLDDLPKALEMAKRAVNLEENNPKYLDFLLEISLSIKDKVLAQDTWNRLKIVNPENNKLTEFKEKIDHL